MDLAHAVVVVGPILRWAYSLLMFYLSICELENDNLKKSEEFLVQLAQNKTHIFWEQSHWYLALNYLKQKNEISAKSELEFIIQEGMSKENEARLILKNLN